MLAGNHGVCRGLGERMRRARARELFLKLDNMGIDVECVGRTQREVDKVRCKSYVNKEYIIILVSGNKPLVGNS